ncbi:MAG: proline dehydrogenase [FCB group bacterium]|nr:proline dehydrogenase [FCB group bacterium]
MIKLFNRLILFFIPHLPLFFVRFVAGRYVAGESCEEAFEVVRKLNAKGFMATIDILGEHTRTKHTAFMITQKYCELFDAIKRRKLDCNISVKPSHIGLDIGEQILRENLLKLVGKAAESGNFLRIDMENSKTTDITLKLADECLAKYDSVGTVLQAYLFRTEDDLKERVGPKLNVRLCKGIYRESPDIAIQDRHEINKNYLKVLKYLFDHEGYVGIATHDLVLLKDCLHLIRDLKVPSDRFEFQVLYGVPMSGWLEKLIKMKYKVRVYVPFGPEWYAYSIRRLQENPNIVGYIFNNLFRRA